MATKSVRVLARQGEAGIEPAHAMYSTPAFAITPKGRQEIVETVFISSECSHDGIRPENSKELRAKR
jgi:hypothetical protein